MIQPQTYNIHNAIISILEGDITKHQADVIVNAANHALLGEDGVDGAIHIAAGPELQIECNKTGYCAVTDVVVTKAYNLPARHVFHTVGPQWADDEELAESLLFQTYSNNLSQAEELQVASIVFPSISTGQYGVPTQVGARAFARALQYFFDTVQPKYLLDIRMIIYYDPDFDELSDASKQYAHHLQLLTDEYSKQ